MTSTATTYFYNEFPSSIITDSPKFKRGDRVKCIGNPRSFTGDDNPGYAGAGWRKGFSFMVDYIHTSIQLNASLKRYVYFPGGGGCGVFENFLELANSEWDE